MDRPFATLAELANFLREPQQAAWQTVIDVVSGLIEEQAPLVKKIPGPPSAAVKAACLQAAARVIANPTGLRREGIGNYNVDYEGLPAGLHLTDDELELLSAYRVAATSLPISVRRP